MLSNKRKRAQGFIAPVAGSLAVALAVAAAGCSSDVTRFKLGGGSTTGSIPVPDQPIGPTGLTKGPPGQGSVVITETDLSAVEPPTNYEIIGRKTDRGQPTLGPQPKQKSDVASGGTVEVQQGDTIYNIARRYGVAPAAIKDANGLTSDTLRPGQRLVIPGANGSTDGSKIGTAPPPRTEPKLVKITPIPVTPAPTPTSAHPGWEGTYVVKNGDTLYGIASEHKVPLEDLKRVNGITDPTKVWPGRVLMVPSRPDAVAKAPPPAQSKGTPPPRVFVDKSTKQADTPAPPPHAEVAGKFRWPVRGGGRLIVGYGKRPDGTHNDGINLAVPLGTDVIAVESGKVAYAGSELKAYGNLILIRHSKEWVSAYAHADQVLVRSGDEVKKGQVIAKAGKTGSVDQPQLHFELRQGSRPVDPLPHLASAN